MFAEAAKAAAVLALGIFIAIDDEKQTRDDERRRGRLGRRDGPPLGARPPACTQPTAQHSAEPIVHEIASGNAQFCRRYVSTTVLQCDLVGYTKLTADHTPQQVVDFISELARAFDVLADRYGVDKVKTIGDAYVVCSGALSEAPEAGHAATVVAMRSRCSMQSRAAAADSSWAERGRADRRALGELVGGIIGTVRFHFDTCRRRWRARWRWRRGRCKGRLHIGERATARLLPQDLFAMTPVRGDDLGEGSLVGAFARPPPPPPPRAVADALLISTSLGGPSRRSTWLARPDRTS